MKEQSISFRVLLKPLTKISEYVNLSGINEKYYIYLIMDLITIVL